MEAACPVIAFVVFQLIDLPIWLTEWGIRGSPGNAAADGFKNDAVGYVPTRTAASALWFAME